MARISTYRGEAGDPESLADALAEAGFDLDVPVTATRHVLDTFDGRLRAAGVRVEHVGAALVIAGGGCVPASFPAPTPPLSTADLPAGAHRELLDGIIAPRVLLPLVAMTTRSRWARRRNRSGAVVAVAEIIDRLGAGPGHVDGWFVEVHEVAGRAKEAARLRRLVLADDRTRLVDDDDVVGLACAELGVDADGHHDEPSVPLEPDMTALDGFRAVLANLADAIDANLDGTIEDLDPEFLHDFRVAVRRTRSVVASGKKVLPADVLAWAKPDLRSLGRLTGPPRDLDVYVLEWDRYVAELPPEVVAALQPVRDQLDADRARAHVALADALRSEASMALLARWRDWLSEPVEGTDGGPHATRPLVDVVRTRIESAQHRLIEKGRAIEPTTSADRVHDLRKDAKRLRYLLECFAGLLPAVERKAFVKRLKTLQDNLGEHQDAAVHIEELEVAVRELPPTTGPDTFVAIGRLLEQLEQRRRRAREAFARRFDDYDSKPTRTTMRAMLDDA
jgi:CHAD domain-containing protein